MEDRIIEVVNIEEDISTELSLRPQRIKEYIGQEKVKEKLKIFVEAAKKEKKL